MKTIRIKDYYGDYHLVPVSDELYEEWVKLNNEQQRVNHKEYYHRSCIPLEEADKLLYAERLDELIDELIQQQMYLKLYKAISHLTPTQQRRVLMFMDNMSYTDIAQSEGTKFAPVYRSLQAAFKKLRSLMKDFEES